MLNGKEVAQYSEQGYALVPEFLSRAEMDAILAEIERIKGNATVGQHDLLRMEMEPNQGPEGKAVRRIYEPCTYYPGFTTSLNPRRLWTCWNSWWVPTSTSTTARSI